ncbi:MAG TPA: amidase family protein [Acidimicrobiia bacterium]
MAHATPLVGETAVELADLVRAGAVAPVEIVDAHLDQIARYDSRVGAFQIVRVDAARAEAEALAARVDLAELPLAGVPVAIKDTIAVEGEPTRVGSLATSDAPATADSELVRRLRAAGAIVLGKTKVPELCAWAWTDSAFGITRNPWSLDRTPGGSSGGSAAAIAAAMVPIAHGSDGGGSIRTPAAACGLVGIKPGQGVVPGAPGRSGWKGLSSDGPLASTVDDLALALSVLADRPALADATVPGRALRVAVSVRSPLGADEIDPSFADATRSTGELLARAGHAVTAADPPYGFDMLLGMGTRAFAGMAADASEMPRSRLERRSRTIVLLGAAVQRLGLVRDTDRDRWRARAREFFEDFDVLVTPTLSAPPVPAEGWSRRSWLANTRAATFAPFTGPWNLAGYPAAAVPAGMHPDGVPLSVQVVAPEGGESLVLSVAKQLEALRPWPRHAPLVASGA